MFREDKRMAMKSGRTEDEIRDEAKIILGKH